MGPFSCNGTAFVHNTYLSLKEKNTTLNLFDRLTPLMYQNIHNRLLQIVSIQNDNLDRCYVAVRFSIAPILNI